MDTAKLFQSGSSQAVRLPKEYRFQGTKVYIKRVGNAVVLIPEQDSWQSLIDSLDLFSDDFMEKRELPWKSIYDAEAPEGKGIADHYGVMSIPLPILIDREGRVVSMSARGPELDTLAANRMPHKWLGLREVLPAGAPVRPALFTEYSALPFEANSITSRTPSVSCTSTSASPSSRPIAILPFCNWNANSVSGVFFTVPSRVANST